VHENEAQAGKNDGDKGCLLVTLASAEATAFFFFDILIHQEDDIGLTEITKRMN
jgi:hypothetical protein